MPKEIPFTKDQIVANLRKHPTPIYVYDEQGIRATARELRGAFGWANGYRNYFAVKALPNPSIMQILKEEGMGFDASSLAELELCARIGATGAEIMFTSNNTPPEDFKRALELGATINFDDVCHLDYLEQHGLELPELVCFRYNPGPTRQSAGNAIIGNPEDAKYGLTYEQLFDAYRLARERGATKFGLHTMVVSNELSIDALLETAQMLFELAVELYEKLGITLEFVNLGGGLGIPYQPEQPPVDVQALSMCMKELYRQLIIANGLPPLQIVSEHGRYVTGPHGYLLTKVRHLKSTYKEYVGVDASMADLMRPGVYGAYHHITILGKETMPNVNKYDVVGSLCENNDKFAIDRMLPKVVVNDVLVIHDAGAHGHAMGFNYNGKLRPAEFLLTDTKKLKMIRRAETLDDYFATLPVRQ